MAFWKLAALAAVLVAAANPAWAAPLRVEVPGGERVLVGSLHLPAGPGPHPAVVMIPGSDNTPRNHPFWQAAADRLTAAGFAVLISDKRGVGESPGTYVEMPDLRQSARDALAQVKFLKARAGIRGDRIGLMGISQGGWSGPLAADMSSDVAFLVMVSGPGVSPMEQNLYQREQEWREAGLSESAIAEMTAYLRTVWPYYGTGLGHEAAAAAWAAAKPKPWFAQTEVFAAYFDDLPGSALRSKPYFSAYRMYGYDPKPVLARLHIPVLAVYGAADRHIPVQASAEAVAEAFWQGGNPKGEVLVVPGAGHLIQQVDGREPMTAKSGAEAIFNAPPAPGYWEAVTAWLRRQAGLEPKG